MQSPDPTRLFALIIAEDAAERAALKTALTGLRFRQVYEAPDALAGLVFLERTVEQIDVIFYLPRPAGVKLTLLLEGLKALAPGCPPLILIDDPIGEPDATLSRQFEIAAFLAKPFSPSLLEAKIQIALMAPKRPPG
jgi:DNA-binding NtrC family response regulator